MFGGGMGGSQKGKQDKIGQERIFLCACKHCDKPRNYHAKWS